MLLPPPLGPTRAVIEFSFAIKLISFNAYFSLFLYLKKTLSNFTSSPFGFKGLDVSFNGSIDKTESTLFNASSTIIVFSDIYITLKRVVDIIGVKTM